MPASLPHDPSNERPGTGPRPSGGFPLASTLVLGGALMLLAGCAGDGREAGSDDAGTEDVVSAAGADTAAAGVAEGDGTGIRDAPAGIGASMTRLPEDFPASMPLPEPYAVVASTSGAAAEINVTLHTPLSLDELAELYDQGLPEGGWEVPHRRESELGGLRAIVYGMERGEASAVVQLTDDPARALRVVSIGIGGG